MQSTVEHEPAHHDVLMGRLNGGEIEKWLTNAPVGAPVYLVGIGGCGMSGLAHLLLDLGFTVYGSDLQTNSAIR